MKKNKLVVLILLLAVIIMCSASPAKAQEKKSSTSESGSQCFDGSTRLLNFGIGIGGRNYYAYNRGLGESYNQSPAFSFMYEQAIKNKLGPGYLGVGFYLGLQTARYRYEYDYYNNNGNHNGRKYYQHRWTYYMLAARGAYHLDLLNWEKGEVYFGALLGLRISTYKYSTDNTDPNYPNYGYSGSSTGFTGSLFAGGRYYLTNRVGAFMELGYGISYLTLGVTIKL